MSRHERWRATPALLARIAEELNEEQRLRAEAEAVNPIRAVLPPRRKKAKK